MNATKTYLVCFIFRCTGFDYIKYKLDIYICVKEGLKIIACIQTSKNLVRALYLINCYQNYFIIKILYYCVSHLFQLMTKKV